MNNIEFSKTAKKLQNELQLLALIQHQCGNAISAEHDLNLSADEEAIFLKLTDLVYDREGEGLAAMIKKRQMLLRAEIKDQIEGDFFVSSEGKILDC